MALHACAACHRHIRRNTCDFCGHVNDFAPAPPRTLRGAATGAALVLGGALAVGACQSDPADPAPEGVDAADSGPTVEDATPPGLDAAYGGPPIEFDATPLGPDAAYGGPPLDAALPSEAGVDATPPGLDAAYGGPPLDGALPPDAAVDAAAPDTGPVAAYGGPPIDQDAMPAAPAYGAPPM